MAQPIICALCESEPGALIATLAHDGTTVIVGPDCLTGFCAGLVEALTGLRLIPTPDQDMAGAGETAGPPADSAADNGAVPKSEAEEAEDDEPTVQAEKPKKAPAAQR